MIDWKKKLIYECVWSESQKADRTTQDKYSGFWIIFCLIRLLLNKKLFWYYVIQKVVLWFG